MIDVAVGGLAAPVAAEQTASLHVTQRTVSAGGSVEVTGTCDPNSEGFAISTAFLHDAAHNFAGVGAAASHTDPAGHFLSPPRSRRTSCRVNTARRRGVEAATSASRRPSL